MHWHMCPPEIRQTHVSCSGRQLLSAMQVVLSDSNEPGEGEHKIMRFVRHQRSCPEYDPNTHHVIFGQVCVIQMLSISPLCNLLQTATFCPALGFALQRQSLTMTAASEASMYADKDGALQSLQSSASNSVLDSLIFSCRMQTSFCWPC